MLHQLLLLLTMTVALNVAVAQNFTVVNGQVYTPGLIIVDAPQPFTPEGGDYLQVAMDISGDGRLPVPPYQFNSSNATQIHNITMFLFSYITGKNFTIANGVDAPANEIGYLGDVLLQEPGSTVKHVNWVWPDCLVGDGSASDSLGGNGSARGPYNISIHQSFTINSTAYYTIFDLPISVTNSIPRNTSYPSNPPNHLPTHRPSCDTLNNPLLSQALLNASVNSLPFQPWIGGSPSITGVGSTTSSTKGGGSSGIGSSSGSVEGRVVRDVLATWPAWISAAWLCVTVFFVSM